MEDASVSKLHHPGWTNSDIRRVFRPQTATLVMLGIVLACALVVVGWFAGEGTIEKLIDQYQWFQKNPPIWLQVPMATGEFLIAPAIALTVITFAITKISPQPRVWSRFVVVAILLILTIRYVIWRSLWTLNLGTPLQGVFSVGLFILELLMIVNGVLQLFLLVQARDRRADADTMAMAVEKGEFLPSVDVMIPTYNEPAFILRRTIIGCQAMDYPRKNIYVLDDTRREEIRALAEELGCEYVCRQDNKHAKAGNLNNALMHTHGDLIACFDADFVPTRNFLKRTVGFFQDDKVALVQTPQSYYNSDPIARNLGLENILVPEQEVFYRQIQPVRDGTDSVVCAGTSFVMRRSALLSTGGEFVTSSLSEDYFTAVRLSGKGYRLIYLDEKLSAGTAPEDMGAQATQRLRWAQGTLQAFFIDENPLTIPGLRPLQRLSHFTGILHWFTSLSRVGFLLMPLAYSFVGIIPIRATTEQIIFYFLPQYLVHLTVFSWLSYRSRSSFLSDIYDVVLCFPLAATVIQTMFKPFGKGFKVTPKGSQRDRLMFNWSLAWPLIALFVLTAVSLWRNMGNCMMRISPAGYDINYKGLSLGWIWSSYNLVLIGIALLVMLDLPKPDLYEWFTLQRVVRISYNPELSTRDSHTQTELEFPTNGSNAPINTFWGTTAAISEVGAQILLTQSGIPQFRRGEAIPIVLEIMEEGIKLKGIITQSTFDGEFPCITVRFEQVTLAQHRQLVAMLFCRPGQWKRQNSPGELLSLWLLFRSLVRPRALFGKRNGISAIAVTQT
ncbi:glycosyltransferase [Pseudanabaena sp. PCC 6802]|uniref:glycosyltransferase n=1 Tax=Pseudanabaena sp. PCC 6802 TaxID=118173 RepID=UPI000347B146|nr:cellulose synthase catalytic subunit [Pseudanabaena sp. PCC 6802]